MVLLILLMAATFFAYSQTEYNDFIYLKNGTMLYGRILEETPGESLKLETADGSVLVYRMDEIEKIKRTTNKAKQVQIGNGLERGYKGIVEIGYGVSVGEYGLDRYRLDFINGFQFNPYFSMGVGLALRRYSKYEATVLAFMADFRVNFQDADTSPYFALGLGPAFDATNTFESMGMMLDPHLGISLRLGPKNFLNFGLGMEFQRLTVLKVMYGGLFGTTMTEESRQFSKAVNFTLGLSF